MPTFYQSRYKRNNYNRVPKINDPRMQPIRKTWTFTRHIDPGLGYKGNTGYHAADRLDDDIKYELRIQAAEREREQQAKAVEREEETEQAKVLKPVVVYIKDEPEATTIKIEPEEEMMPEAMPEAMPETKTAQQLEKELAKEAKTAKMRKRGARLREVAKEWKPKPVGCGRMQKRFANQNLGKILL